MINLAHLRTSIAKCTQQQLADAADVPRTTISTYEQYISQPNAQVLFDASKYRQARAILEAIYVCGGGELPFTKLGFLVDMWYNHDDMTKLAEEIINWYICNASSV